MVFYRKYRPQTIAELDSKKVRDTLTAILSKDPPHAFLFTGPKGLGKTSTARIIAKAVNCVGRENGEKGKQKTDSISSVEPDNICEQCLSITNGSNMDVIEIDAASNRGIDEIRDLKEKIRLLPLKAKKKVYIIDEVHMLTTEAFNALLKTLEEPPDHALFILCTTEPHKVPATILSRSFHIAFSKATDEELVRSFKRIADLEKLSVTDEVLYQIATLSDGGFRDGAKIMEEMALASNGKPITKELLETHYSIASISQAVDQMLQHLLAKDTKQSLALIAALVAKGVDMKFFMQSLIDRLHEELLVAAGVTSDSKPSVSLLEGKKLLLLFVRAHADVKYAVLSQIPLELAIIEWGETAPENQEIAYSQEVTTSKTESDVTIKSLRKKAGHMQKVQAMYGNGSISDIKGKPSDNINTSHVSLMHYSSSADTKEWIDNLWKNIISEMKGHNHTLAGVLRGCVIKSYDRKSLIIETLYTFHKDRLTEAKTKTVLEEIVKQLTGNDVNVTIELKKSS